MAIIDKVVTKDSLRYFLLKLQNYFASKTDITIKSVSVDGTIVQPDTNKNVNIVTAGTYTLPPATSTTLGGIKVGDNLSVAADGTLSADAQPNIIEKIQVNGTDQTIANKTVNISVPTNNNQLSNGAGYQTASDVASAIATAKMGRFVIVESLPTTGDPGVIYLVPKTTSQTQNEYDEYMYISEKWEKIGDTEIDLSNYLKISDISEITNEDIDELFEE